MGTDQFAGPSKHVSLDAEIRDGDNRSRGFTSWCEDVVLAMIMLNKPVLALDFECARDFLERINFNETQGAFDDDMEPQHYAQWIDV